MDSFETELKVGFLDEAAQGITDVEQCFLDLETDPSNQDTLNKIFRLAHNLKGSSRAVGFENMGEFTHEFESFILKVKNGELSASYTKSYQSVTQGQRSLARNGRSLPSGFRRSY